MPGEPPPRSWCRVSVQVSMVPPAPGRIISVERSARTLRAVLFAPRPVVLGLTLALVGNHPWFVHGFDWLRQLLGW